MLTTFDIEIYINYFLIKFKNPETNKTLSFELKGEDATLSINDIDKIKYIFATREVFGFNSNSFDIPVLLLAFKGAMVKDIKVFATHIIKENLPQWKSLDLINVRVPKNFNHFDIMEVAPGVRVSLKIYGGRLHSTKLQDLPYPPDAVLTDDQMAKVNSYCENDLDTNIDLYKALKLAFDLRREMSSKYFIDLRSKSDAQIAETLIKIELQKINGFKPKKPVININDIYKYKPPSYIKFKTKKLNRLLNFILKFDFKLDSKGYMRLPEKLEGTKISLGDSIYTFGIGGLHSTEKKVYYKADDNFMICDRDVTSYYPSMILNNRWSPEHLGDDFINLYKSIYNERLKAKKDSNAVMSDTYKIILNGSFGKLGSKYSVLYAPNLLLHVTLTGQLSLLMLIEELELNGIKVVSANTDGFVSFFPKGKYSEYDSICNAWELNSDLTLEETQYKALYSRDVNNYYAVTDNGSKGKGVFTLGKLNKNPSYDISTLAVMEYLNNGVDVAKTIKNCKDITKFLCLKQITGGGLWKDNYLGKVARWVYTKDNDDFIKCKSNGNKVATSDGAYPVMDLSKIDDDIWNHLDYDKYINIANDLLTDLGV
jgi:DNA polymerase elongation subunit (family B)